MVDPIIRNRIEECADGKRHGRAIEEIRRAILHRLSFAPGIPDAELDGAAVARMFADRTPYAAGSYTRGEMAYGIVILTSGVIDQCLELGDHGQHAGRWNHTGLGIAVVGDFTQHAPTPQQMESLTWLCAQGLGMGWSIHGHTEIDGASNDPRKSCPGPYMRLDWLREAAVQRRKSLGLGSDPDRYAQALYGAGVTF